jgi:CDGSH-type Zn-finger protein
MAEPVIAQKEPFGVEVTTGRSYWWCACGLSKKQPFCDGTHKGTGLAPVKFEATADETVWFCGCKATQGKPLCDGTHNGL